MFLPISFNRVHTGMPFLGRTSTRDPPDGTYQPLPKRRRERRLACPPPPLIPFPFPWHHPPCLRDKNHEFLVKMSIFEGEKCVRIVVREKHACGGKFWKDSGERKREQLWSISGAREQLWSIPGAREKLRVWDF